MSNILKRERLDIQVHGTGRNYLLSLAKQLSASQRRAFIEHYRKVGHPDAAASYALEHASLWACGAVKPRSATVTLYCNAIQTVMDADQKRLLLEVEGAEYCRQLKRWSDVPNDMESFRSFFLEASSAPASVVPRFSGIASEHFTRDEIEAYTLSDITTEVYNVALVVSKMALIQRCDDAIDLLRAPRIAIHLRHKSTGLCADVSERAHLYSWDQACGLFVGMSTKYNPSLDRNAIRIAEGEQTTAVEDFAALIARLSQRYHHDLSHSDSATVSSLVENTQWSLTVVAPYQSAGVLDKSRQIHRWTLLTGGSILTCLMIFTSSWLPVFIGASAFAAIMSSYLNRTIDSRTVEYLRTRLVNSRD